MASSTTICNLALSKLGQDPILALTEDSVAGRACNLVYDSLRKAVLRKGNWNFAIKRASLAQLTTTPTFGWSYEYQLPADFLKLVNTSYEEYLDVGYKIEGTKLLTDETTFAIAYVSDFQDENNFDDSFVEALATRIAAELALDIVQDKVLKRELLFEYGQKVNEALSLDSQDDTPDEFITTTWTNSRI